MQMIAIVRRVHVAIGLAILGTGTPALAQEFQPDFRNSSYLAAGWVANAPDALLGGGISFIRPTGIGFFANVRVSHEDPGGESNFLPNVTVDQALNEFGDFRFHDESKWLLISGGLIRTLTPELALYAGAGLARRDYYQQFEDPDGQRGELGFYWVRDDESSGDFASVLGGVLFRAGRNLIIQFGAETEPRGMTIGVHLGLPRGTAAAGQP